jgi:hypothetical protein
MTMTVHPARATVLIASASGAAWLLADQGLGQARLTPSLESIVTAAIELGGAAAAVGVAALTLAALVEALLGWRPRAAGALPAPVRRLVMTSVAAAVAVGAAMPATADDVYPAWGPAEPSAAPAPVELHAESAAPPVADSGPTLHRVVRGESLWRIAAERLGPDASDAQIAAAWPTIYAANRDTIGDDPGLILPGQLLAIPEAVSR